MLVRQQSRRGTEVRSVAPRSRRVRPSVLGSDAGLESSIRSRPACDGQSAARPARLSSLLRRFLRRFGLSPGCPVFAHPLGDRPALLLAHRALPPADRLGLLLPAAPGGRPDVGLDSVDRALYGNELALERALRNASRIPCVDIVTCFPRCDPPLLPHCRRRTPVVGRPGNQPSVDTQIRMEWTPDADGFSSASSRRTTDRQRSTTAGLFDADPDAEAPLAKGAELHRTFEDADAHGPESIRASGRRRVAVPPVPPVPPVPLCHLDYPLHRETDPVPARSCGNGPASVQPASCPPGGAGKMWGRMPAQAAQRLTVDESTGADVARRRVACESARTRGASTRPLSARPVHATIVRVGRPTRSPALRHLP